MNIPEELRVFSLIYEFRNVFLIPLFIIWIGGFFYLLFKQRKKFFIWLLILPFIIQPINIAATYCGWHYRMELRKRFGKMPGGFINIDYMPPEIRKEYAKRNYHPRLRDIKVMIIGTIPAVIITYIIGGILYAVVYIVRKNKKIRQNRINAF